MSAPGDGILTGCGYTPGWTSSHGKNEITPEYIVWHYTACSAEAALAAFKNPKVAVSAHFLVKTDGTVIQCVPCNRPAWHAGQSEWAGRKGLNQFSIGIELENLGPLRNGYPVKDTYGRKYDGPVLSLEQPVHGFKNWADYPEEQLDAAEKLARNLIALYPIQDMLGHSDVAPKRKIDPGPAFPMARFDALLETAPDRSSDDGPDLQQVITIVTANVRNDSYMTASVVRVVPPNTVFDIPWGYWSASSDWVPVKFPGQPAKELTYGQRLGYLHRKTFRFL